MLNNFSTILKGLCLKVGSFFGHLKSAFFLSSFSAGATGLMLASAFVLYTCGYLLIGVSIAVVAVTFAGVTIYAVATGKSKMAIGVTSLQWIAFYLIVCTVAICIGDLNDEENHNVPCT